jgi:hypothetical protein
VDNILNAPVVSVGKTTGIVEVDQIRNPNHDVELVTFHLDPTSHTGVVPSATLDR